MTEVTTNYAHYSSRNPTFHSDGSLKQDLICLLNYHGYTVNSLGLDYDFVNGLDGALVIELLATHR